MSLNVQVGDNFIPIYMIITNLNRIKCTDFISIIVRLSDTYPKAGDRYTKDDLGGQCCPSQQ